MSEEIVSPKNLLQTILESRQYRIKKEIEAVIKELQQMGDYNPKPFLEQVEKERQNILKAARKLDKHDEDEMPGQKFIDDLVEYIEEPKVEYFFEVEQEYDLLDPITDYRSCPTTIVVMQKIKLKWSLWAWFINFFTKKK